MKSLCISILMVVAMGIVSVQDVLADSADSAAAQIRALRKQVDDAYIAYTSTNDRSGKLFKAYQHLNDTNLPKIFDLAKRDPASEASFQALAWVFTNPQINSPSLRTFASRSLELLSDYHTTNSDIGEICWKLGGRSWNPTDKTALEFLRAASESNPDRYARGYATLALGQMLEEEVAGLRFFEALPPAMHEWSSEIKTAHQQAGKTALLSAEAEKTLETVLTKYADVPTQSPQGIPPYKGTLGAKAKVELFELNHLMPGEVAPEISGEDIDGHTLSLSQYRGKVVVLTFWVTRSGPCQRLLQAECSVAERFKGQPLAMLGINGDDTRDTAKRSEQEQQITWQSFWDESGSDGAISEQWNLHSWPTTYVLDRAGIIRLKFVGYGGAAFSSDILDSITEQLLKEP